METNPSPFIPSGTRNISPAQAEWRGFSPYALGEGLRPRRQLRNQAEGQRLRSAAVQSLLWAHNRRPAALGAQQCWRRARARSGWYGVAGRNSGVSRESSEDQGHRPDHPWGRVGKKKGTRGSSPHASIGRRRHHSPLGDTAFSSPEPRFSPPPPPSTRPGLEASHWVEARSIRLESRNLLDKRPKGGPQPARIGLLHVGATEEAAGRGCASARAGLPRRRRRGVRRWGAGSGGSGGCCGWERAGSVRLWSAMAEPPPPQPRRSRSRRLGSPMGGGGSHCGAGRAARRHPRLGRRHPRLEPLRRM
jgi:hypothetical protein